ncbi:MAG: DUF4329 domain-containing protein [Pseudomonadota bacterium]
MNERTAPFIYGVMAIIVAIIVVRAYLNVKGPEDFVITVTQAEVQEFARSELDALQEQSFAEDIELCGIIFEEEGGTLGATRPRIGDEASCGISYFDEPGMRPVASFHTHASQNDAYDSEVPSVLDLVNDAGSGMDGYVATPGGRFWHIDANGPVANMICGAGCLSQDPSYKPCPALEPTKRYTLEELRVRQSGVLPDC